MPTRMPAWAQGTGPNNQVAPITIEEAQKFFDAAKKAGAILRGGTGKRPEDGQDGFILSLSLITGPQAGVVVSCSLNRGNERIANISTEPASKMRPVFNAAGVSIPKDSVFNGEAPKFKEKAAEDPNAKPKNLNEI